MSTFFVSCAKGLEYLLVDELIALGAEKATAALAGAHAHGDLRVATRAVLWSRLASRVLWPLVEFECPDQDALYTEVAKLPWWEHLRSDQTLAIDAHVSGTELTHERFAAQRVKDAIVDVLREKTGTRPDVDTENPDLRLGLSVRKGIATLSVDLGGGSLHRRGWRQAQGAAPLKENVAAAVLLRGTWPAIYADGGTLLDPMCGSGTLLIEGAQMAADVAPGLLRFGERIPSRWLGFDVAMWNELRAEAQERERFGRALLRNAFEGSDLDSNALAAARANVAAAGFAAHTRLQLRRIRALESPGTERGLVVANPPYAARMAADAELYRELGDALKTAVPGWRASLLCGSVELAHATGIRALKRYQLFNGSLECALLVCDPIQQPNKSAEPQGLSEGATMAANRLRKNLKKLEPWAAREKITCFRVYDSDLPEYASAIDVYHTGPDAAPVRYVHVQESPAPADIPERDVKRRRNELLAAVREVLQVPRERIALDVPDLRKQPLRQGQEPPPRILVREAGAKLHVDLAKWGDPGLRLDQRLMREQIANEARGQRFLHLAPGSGAATVFAALAPAEHLTVVEPRKDNLDWLAENLGENAVSTKNRLLIEREVLGWLENDDAEYDLILFDVPVSLHFPKPADPDFQRAHVKYLQAAMARLAPHGVFYFSDRMHRFRPDLEAIAAFAQIEEITASTIPKDFERTPRIHRTWKLQPL